MSLDAGNPRSYPGTGTTWYDRAGNLNAGVVNNGTLVNSPTFDSSNKGSIGFNGSNSYVSCGTFTGLGSSNRTFDVWVKILASPAGTLRIISFPTDDTSLDTPAFTMGYVGTNVTAGFGGTPYNGYYTSMPYTLNIWANFTASIAGNTISAYKNGVYLGQATNTGSVGANAIGYIARYNSAYGQYGNIQVSNLKVYNRDLSASEVLQNYNATKSRFT